MKIDNLVISLSFAFVFGVFAPLDFLYSNLNDIWLDFSNIIWGIMIVSACMFLAMFCFLSVIDILPNGKMWVKWIKVLIFCVFCAIYIQGNFVRIPYGALDGTPIVWNEYILENITDTIAMCGIFTVIIIAYAKLEWNRFIKYAGRIMLAIMAITIFTLFIEYVVLDGFRDKTYKMSTTKNEWVYSSNRNVNILLLDYFDSRLLTELLRDDADTREMINDFEGFTFYRDTLGCYNLTDYSIPTILTGQLYFGDKRYGEYIENAYKESALFNRLSEEGWDTNIYTTITLPQNEAADYFSNLQVMHLKAIYDKKLIRDYYGMVCFRYMPNIFKRYFYKYYFEVGANKEIDGQDNTEDTVFAYNLDNGIWNNECMKEYTIVDENVFHFYHLNGVHPPRQYHSDLSFTSYPDEVGLLEGAKLSMVIAHNWINRLKECGIYDNSVIIIMADHGSWEYEDDHHISQTPLLLIKGYDEQHEFRINQSIPVSYLDIQSALMNLMDGEDSINCFNDVMNRYGISDKKDEYYCVDELDTIVQGEATTVGRARVFYFTYLMNEMGYDSVGGPFFEGYTDYPAYEPNYMKRTGYVYQ